MVDDPVRWNHLTLKCNASWRVCEFLGLQVLFQEEFFIAISDNSFNFTEVSDISVFIEALTHQHSFDTESRSKTIDICFVFFCAYIIFDFSVDIGFVTA